MGSSDSSLLCKLAAAWPAERWREVTALVAVSGGADSVALARGLAALQRPGAGRLILTHFNHRLRGAESDGDQAFVEQMGRELGLAVVVGARVGEGERESEETLRDERYVFFRLTAAKAGARYVAMAHTADDQVETVLHNILRGTGLAGLAGIPPVRPLNEAAAIVRPLLAVTRAEVLAYLTALGQEFRTDSSNQALDYTRNCIRHELLPLLERDYNSRVREALLRLSHIAAEADEVLDAQAALLLERAMRPEPQGIVLDVEALSNAPPALARHALLVAWRGRGWPLQDMSFDRWEELRQLALTQRHSAMTAAKRTLPGGIRGERAGGTLRLTK